MRVDVRELAPGESTAVQFDQPLALQTDDQTVTAQAAGTLHLQRTNRGVTVRGRVQAAVPLVCGRCLLSFQSVIGVEIQEEFSLESAEGAAGGELASEDFVSWVGPAHEVDLGEIVRQHLQMNVPMAPLHAEDCRGLCPACGANWNDGVCEHYRAQG